MAGWWRLAGQDGADVRSHELRTDRMQNVPLLKRIVAGTLRLPATVEVSADTTILARTIVFGGPRFGS